MDDSAGIIPLQLKEVGGVGEIRRKREEERWYTVKKRLAIFIYSVGERLYLIKYKQVEYLQVVRVL